MIHKGACYIKIHYICTKYISCIIKYTLQLETEHRRSEKSYPVKPARYIAVMLQFCQMGNAELGKIGSLEWYYFFFFCTYIISCQRKLTTGFICTSDSSTAHSHEMALGGICYFSVCFGLSVTKIWWYRCEVNICFHSGNRLFNFSLIHSFEINF